MGAASRIRTSLHWRQQPLELLPSSDRGDPDKKVAFLSNATAPASAKFRQRHDGKTDLLCADEHGIGVAIVDQLALVAGKGQRGASRADRDEVCAVALGQLYGRAYDHGTEAGGGKRTYIIMARRITSGDELIKRNRITGLPGRGMFRLICRSRKFDHVPLL